jgi:hypothetical protein
MSAVKTGKTTVLAGEQAREPLDSIDVSTLVGLRDRALIAVMTFAFARIGAVVAMRVADYCPNGKRWWVRRTKRAASAIDPAQFLRVRFGTDSTKTPNS